MKERSRFLQLAMKGLEEKGLIQDQRYKDRLKREIKEVDAQGEHDYYLGLYDKFRAQGLMFPTNEFNTLLDYVLGLAPSFDIEKPYIWVQGEVPDIDIDYARPVRDYIKRTWAAKTFGQENICEIGSYGTAGVKGGIKSMARIHGLDFEINAITKEMEDKDDDGKELEWDTALEIYPEFKRYCEEHPEVARAAELLMGRQQSGSVHAAGLIVSDRRIDGFVPLEVRSVTKENPNGVICSAWTEGLNRQDLQPVGLIKFDLLVITNLMQIFEITKLVKERHGLEHICAQDGLWDWSDISYLNDPKALAMANDADLRGIFQFDSEGIRKLVKRGGVNRFDDLAAYSALYRPGPLHMGMDARYCKRKKKEEPWFVHPVMQPILNYTYGVMVYQEQITDILQAVGKIPAAHTEHVRKAISKKKEKVFAKYKDMFIDNGCVTLGTNSKYLEDRWEEISAFSAYGFNKSHSYAYAYISARLLYLKAHYPLEFYAGTLACEKKGDKKGESKFKIYKLDAARHGVQVCPVHINKSKENFTIEDGKIYYGFGNIKGVGKEAQRIVDGQGYKNFVDFLEKTGADAKVVKPLCALGVFDDPHDRLTLRRFAEAYKNEGSKQHARKKRFQDSLDKKLLELKCALMEELDESDSDFDAMHDFTPEAEALWEKRFKDVVRHVPYKYKGEDRIKEVPFVKFLQDIAKKRQNTIENNAIKDEIEENQKVDISRYDLENVKLKEDEVAMLTDEMVVNDKKFYPSAERFYYGFQWGHVLETSPDFTGETFDTLLSVEGLKSGPVEVLIVDVKARTSKSGNPFYTVYIEDADGIQMKMQVWQGDYQRFKEELIVGNMVKVQVLPPSGGFDTLTFKSVPRHLRRTLPPKEEDYRLIVMRKAEPPQVVEQPIPEVEVNGDEFQIME